MLVLSRKIGQEIVVGDSVRITVTKVSGNRVTLGVDAPDHVRILRGELAPIVCAFETGEEEKEEEEEEEIPDASAQTIAMVGEDVAETIPFLPNMVR